LGCIPLGGIIIHYRSHLVSRFTTRFSGLFAVAVAAPTQTFDFFRSHTTPPGRGILLQKLLFDLANTPRDVVTLFVEYGF
jgi:hypothetical protein